jgi:hypothetical protein
MRQRLQTIAIMLLSCVGVGFAQVVTPPNAVPEQIDGKDYAGRPVAEVKVPAAPPLPVNQSSSSSRMSKTSISTSTGLICGPKIAQSWPAMPNG